MDAEHGIKKLSLENCLEPDKAAMLWLQLTRGASSTSVMTRDYINRILRPQLSKNVPEEVKRLFEVARGALIYGWFYYPLVALAAQHSYRVLEAAVSEKCLEMGGPSRQKRFKTKIDWLITKGVIPKENEPAWRARRELRNMSSHLDRQQIYDPGMAISELERCTADINALFGEEAPKR